MASGVSSFAVWVDTPQTLGVVSSFAVAVETPQVVGQVSALAVYVDLPVTSGVASFSVAVEAPQLVVQTLWVWVNNVRVPVLMERTPGGVVRRR